MENWIIICPGPSLKNTFLSLDDLRGATIVAVNGAIIHAYDVATWWCLMDPEVFTTVSRLKNLDRASNWIRLWTYWGFEEMGLSSDGGRWDAETLEKFKRFESEVWHREENPEEIQRLYPECITPFETYEYLPWNEFTLFTAISLACKKGAKHIQVHGADFKGVGYFDARLTNWRMNHDEKRWMREKIFFGYIQEACGLQGIKVERAIGQ